ncbi:MAG: hypothetical protein J5982_06445 [Bacilli bacterium]|nr:hypothetical protein [Bacilli bacterium]
MLLPVETEFDVENGLLYAEVDELGTYCIMDMEIWLNNLGVEMPEESQPEENSMYLNSPSILSASESSGSVWTPTYTNAPIDLVFILQSAGKSSSHFATEKQLITDFASSIIKEYSDVKITVIEFKKEEANLLTDALGQEYFTNIPMLFAALNNIEYVSENDYCDRGQAFKILLNDISLDFEHDIYVYELINGANTSHTGYDNEDVISKVKNNEIRAYSEIRPYGWHYIDPVTHENISSDIIENNDLFINLNTDTLSLMETHFPTKLSPPRPVYEILLPTKWKKIALKGELNSTNKINSDEDSLTDWEEVNIDELIKLSDGNYTLPHVLINELVNILNRFDSEEYLFITERTLPVYYLPILSDPTESDSDGDGLRDDEDLEPLKIFLNELLGKIRLMEKYIDDYYENQYNEDILHYDDVPPITTPNSTITINIIRNLYYGSEKIIKDNMTRKEHLINIAQQIKWDTTDGTSFPLIRKYIDKKDASLVDYFKKYRSSAIKERKLLIDNQGNKIDFLHLLATLGAERYDGIIDPNLAGWAGDLQSFIYNFKLETYGKEYEYENLTKSEKLTEIAYDMFTGAIQVSKNKFTNEDLLSDVDAKNINEIYSENLRLSSALRGYYTKHYKSRFRETLI